MTTELLGLAPPGVCDQEGTVVGHKLLLQLHCAVSVDVLGVVRNDGLSDGLADGVNLRGVSSTLDADTDIEGSKGVLSSDEDGLVDLEAEDLRLDEVDGGTIDADEATSLPGVSDSGRGLHQQMSLIWRPCSHKRTSPPSFCRKFGRP